MSVDMAKLETLLGKMVGDMGAAAIAPLVMLGDKLGLYRALAANGPISTEDLAEKTGTTNDTFVNGVRPRPVPVTSTTTPLPATSA